MAELAMMVSLAAAAFSAVLCWKMHRQLGDLRKQAEAGGDRDLSEGLRDEVEQLVDELQRSGQVAASHLSAQISALSELTERAALQIESLSGVGRGAGGPEEAEPQAAVPGDWAEPSPSPVGCRADVISLANDGKSPTDIAREVGMSRGEVDLLLQFYRQSGQTIQW